MIRLYMTSIEKLKDMDYFNRKFPQVSQERQEKIRACKMHRDQERSLAAGLLLEYAWKTFLEERGEAWMPLQIIQAQNGKPFCSNRKDFCYNLSHSGEYVICAVAEEPVGADIQQIKTVQPKIARRFFLPEECEMLECCDDKDRVFCRMWAMKESYIKYTGKGMRQNLNTFSVDLEKERIYDCVTGQFASVNLHGDVPGYEIAVCTQKKQKMVVCMWDMEE